jgi:hypothetical protein
MKLWTNANPTPHVASPAEVRAFRRQVLLRVAKHAENKVCRLQTIFAVGREAERDERFLRSLVAAEARLLAAAVGDGWQPLRKTRMP